MVFGLFDPMYLLMVFLPAMLLSLWAQAKVKGAFHRGKQIASRRGYTGRQVAQNILDVNGIRDVRIEPVQGQLSDHYDPRKKVLRLSPDVYNGRSIASAGVAAHEVGHAIQHARGYTPMKLRNAAVPIANFGSNAGMLLAMGGLFLNMMSLVGVGAILFAGVVVFQLVNLPVEFNASRRARDTLVMNGLVDEREDKEIGKVLNAAAFTYVAATITAILTLLYFLMRSGLLGGRD
jgi:hypothetical protein